MTDRSPEQHARSLLAALELMSHVPAHSEGTGRSSEHPGGRRPSGGIDPRDDLTRESTLKSHVYYRKRLNRCHTDEQYDTDEQYERLAAELEATIRAWQHSPPPPRDSDAWKRAVAQDTRKARHVADAWNISRAYVHLLRRAYRENERDAA